MKKTFLYFLPLLMAATSCRDDELVVPTEYEIIGDERPASRIRGLYLVNEGNMGSNKCTLDFYDYMTGLPPFNSLRALAIASGRMGAYPWQRGVFSTEIKPCAFTVSAITQSGFCDFLERMP